MDTSKMPPLQIGALQAKVPIVQGGMGVGISLSNLAAAVANQGAIGVISATGIGMLDPDFNQNFGEANMRALRREMRNARRMTGGIIGVNIMVALTDYEDLLRVAVEEGADVVFLGAGLPLRMPPALATGSSHTKVVPIVSSARAARLIFRHWERNLGRVPDGVVVEGPKAGGHLGFRKEDIEKPEHALEAIVPGVVSEIEPYQTRLGKSIPVIAGGGLFSGADIHGIFQLGARGAQLATRFVGTYECDAAPEFKQAYIRCRKEDLVIIDSPVGMPGRAIRNRFLDEVGQGKKMPYDCHWHCLKTCNVQDSPYCICIALTNAKKGCIDKGFVFAGANAYRVNSIVSVKDLIEGLVREYLEAAYPTANSPNS